MTPVLTVFIDALKPESVEHMEFLNTFYKARIKTDFPSFSNTCHGSMYTGVYPNKHKCQFIWKFSPETSPFKFIIWLEKLPKVAINSYIKRYLFKSICFSKLRTIPYGDAVFERLPIRYWAYFDYNMVKFWGKPDLFIGGYPTIFEILSRHKIPYKIFWIWTPFKPIKTLEKIKPPSNYKHWLYIFIGDIDRYSHKFGPHSSKVQKKLKEIDYLLQKLYLRYKKIFNDFSFLVFSDHGQMRIEKRVSIYSLFKAYGENLNNYIHMVDANYLRFWFRSHTEREKVEKIVSKLDGFILTKEFLAKYHAEIPDNRYGDLILYLDKGVFQEVTPKNTKYMHGYLPDYPDSDGVCVTTKKIRRSYIKLQDIVPSILHNFGLEIPEYMDGDPIWK